MNNMKNLKRRIKVFRLTLLKKISIFLGSYKDPMNSQDRKIKRVVKQFILKENTKVHHSPNNLTFYVYGPERRVVIVFNPYYIRITNHKFFFNSGLHEKVYEEISILAKEKIENSFKKIEKEISYNEENFLEDLYENFSKNKSRTKVSSIIDALKEKQVNK